MPPQTGRSDPEVQPATRDGNDASQLVTSRGSGLQPHGMSQPCCNAIIVMDRPAVWLDLLQLHRLSATTDVRHHGTACNN